MPSMNMVRGFALAAGLVLGTVASAQATSYVDSFPSAGSTVVGSVGFISAGQIGYFWSAARGDRVSQTYAGTGLSEVIGLDLAFDVTFNNLVAPNQVDWDVLINSIVVGSWSWDDTDGTGPVALSYLFAPIAGGGTYTVEMRVTSESIRGSIAIGVPGRMELTGIPEPATLALLGLGLAGLGVARRRKAAQLGLTLHPAKRRLQVGAAVCAIDAALAGFRPRGPASASRSDRSAYLPRLPERGYYPTKR